MIRSHTPAIMGYSFITTLCVLVVSYLMVAVLGHPFPIPSNGIYLGNHGRFNRVVHR